MKRPGVLAVALAAAMGAFAPTAVGQPPTDEPTPPAVEAAPAWIEYRLSQVVTNGTGVYDGWSDRLSATGHYDFVNGEVTSGLASAHARYRWTYRSPDQDRHGSADRIVAYDPVSRLYRQAQIDLDDYDEQPANAERAIWWRIPTDVETGSSLTILDETFVVMGPVPGNEHTHGRASILVEQRHGVGERDDDYGLYATTFTDQYWFDAETGYVLREVYAEHDIGTLEGDYATFDVQETVDVVAASFLPGTTANYDTTTEPALATAPATRSTDAPWEGESSRPRAVRRWIALGALALVAIGALWLWRRRSRAKHDFSGKLRRLGAGDPLPGDVASQTDRFGTLLPHLVKQTLTAGLPVAIAESSTGTAGIALGAPPGEAATIFARDTAACEALRRELGAQHFFSEVRHEHAFAARAAASQHDTPLTGPHAYNVLETHEVMTLEPLPDGGSYDTTLIRRAKAADLPAVVALADQVYGTSCKGWIEAAQMTGDVVLVARADEKIVGFAIVSVTGTTARFHGLTVSPDHRGKGIGKELNRARVKVAHDLGAERALVEVAAWNVASLEIARAAGFTKVGQMFVQTASDTKTDARFQRR